MNILLRTPSHLACQMFALYNTLYLLGRPVFVVNKKSRLLEAGRESAKSHLAVSFCRELLLG